MYVNSFRLNGEFVLRITKNSDIMCSGKNPNKIKDCEMISKSYKDLLTEISKSIKIAGYKPYDQLYGYVKTGNLLFITRTNNARNTIKNIPKDVILEFITLIEK